MTVRKALRVYVFSLSQVESVADGFWGFPKLSVAGRTIRVMGMEQNGMDQIGGGSDDMVVSRAEPADSVHADFDPSRAGVRVRWSPIDRGLALLLAAWGAYAASFFVL